MLRIVSIIRTIVTCTIFGLLAVAAFLVSSNMPIADWIRDEAVIVVKGDDPLLGSICSVAVLELSIKVSLNPLIVAHTCCTNF